MKTMLRLFRVIVLLVVVLTTNSTTGYCSWYTDYFLPNYNRLSGWINGVDSNMTTPLKELFVGDSTWWVPEHGSFCVSKDKIEIMFMVSKNNINFYENEFMLARIPYSLEFDVVDHNSILGDPQDNNTIETDLPSEAIAFRDVGAFDVSPSLSLVIQRPDKLETDRYYHITFKFKQSIQRTGTAHLNIQVGLDLNRMSQVLEGQGGLRGQQSLASGWFYAVLATEPYSNIELSQTEHRGIYWGPDLFSNPGCLDGNSWQTSQVLSAEYPPIPTSTQQNEITTEVGGFATSLGSSSGVVNNPIVLPNLQIKEFNLHDSAGNLLTENTSLLWPGQTYEIHVWPISKEADCINGMEPGKDTVETDTFYKIAMSEDEGSWIFYHRNYTQAEHMVKDDAKKEVFRFTVPSEATGKRIYFRSKTDATGEVRETNESDNWSDVEFYPVQGVFDLTISFARLTNGRTFLNQFDKFGIEMWVKNLGFSNCPVDIRSSYYLKKPGQSTWTYLTDDETPAHHLVPNVDNYEVTLDEPFTADITGTYQCMVCADYPANAAQEINESDNCQTFSFNVIPNGPDLIISSMGIKEGTTISKGTYIHPWAKVKNIGNRTPSSDSRIAYYIDGVYRIDDNVNASQLNPGQEQYEEVQSDIIKLGNTGTRTCTICADYQGKVLEQNEKNNCTSVTITVK